MKISNQYAGKWIASRQEKIVASSKSLKALMSKLKTKKDHGKVIYTLVPKGLIAGNTTIS